MTEFELNDPYPDAENGNPGAFAILKAEIVGAFERLNLAFHIAWGDTRARYRRSVLGPFWLVLGTAIGVGGLGFVWSNLFDIDRSIFIPSLTVGLVVWYLLSGSIVGATAAFYHNRQLLLNMPVSSMLVSIQLLLRELVNFAHNLVIVLVVLVIFPQPFGLTTLLVIPGLVLVCINLLWFIQLIGYFGARFRDLEPLVTAIMQPLFFLTPVIFRPEQLGDSAFILNFNPLAYWLSLIRDPIMGQAPTLLTWIVSLLMAVLGWSAALYITAKKRHRLAYWIN